MAVTLKGSGQVVVQIVNATYSTTVTSASSTFATTGLTATITPTSASNRILVLVDQTGCGKDTNNTRLQLRLMRGSTVLTYFDDIAAFTNTTAAFFVGACSCNYLDSPATTSAVTYSTQLASFGNNATVYVQNQSGNFTTSTITLLEISG